MPLQIVGDLRLQVVARLRPLVEERVQLFELDEQMGRRAKLRRRAGERADRIDQIGRAVVMATLVAVVAVLVGRLAVGTGAVDEPVGQERPGLADRRAARRPSLTSPALRIDFQNSSHSARFSGLLVLP